MGDTDQPVITEYNASTTPALIVDSNVSDPTHVSITPLIADLINTDKIVIENNYSKMEINSGSISILNKDANVSSLLSYVLNTSNETMLDLGSNTMLNVSVPKLLLNGVAAPKDGALVTSTSTGLGWTTISDFLQLDTDRVRNVSSVTAMNVFFSLGVTYTTEPAIILTPDSDGSGQIIPISLNGYLQNASSLYCGFKVLFGSSKLNYFNYLVLPQTNKLLAGTVEVTNGISTAANV